MSIKPADRSLRTYARRVAKSASPRRERPEPRWPRTMLEAETEQAHELRRAEHATRQRAVTRETTWHHGARVTRTA